MKHLSAYHQPEGGNTEVSFVLILYLFIDMIIVIISVSIFVIMMIISWNQVINGASYTLLVPTPTRTLR